MWDIGTSCPEVRSNRFYEIINIDILAVLHQFVIVKLEFGQFIYFTSL